MLTQTIKDQDSAEHKLNHVQSSNRQTDKWFRELTSTLNQTRQEFEQTKKDYADTLALLEEAKQKINELTPPERPAFINYTRDVFFNWIWE